MFSRSSWHSLDFNVKECKNINTTNINLFSDLIKPQIPFETTPDQNILINENNYNVWLKTKIYLWNRMTRSVTKTPDTSPLTFYPMSVKPSLLCDLKMYFIPYAMYRLCRTIFRSGITVLEGRTRICVQNLSIYYRITLYR